MKVASIKEMNFFHLAFLTLVTPKSLEQCTLNNYRVRSNFKDLSPGKRLSFVNALNTLNQRPVPNAWTELHDHYWNRNNRTQNTAISLEWNRVYLFQAEKILKEVDPSISLPYWDLADTGSYPTSASEGSDATSALSEDWFGGEKVGECINLSRFTFPDAVCIVRHIGPYDFTFPEPVFVKGLAGSSTYSDLVKDVLSFSPKVYSKANVLVSYPFQPADPLFLLYAAAIDRIWMGWQIKNPEKYRHILVDSDTVVEPWQIPIRQIVDPFTRLCYTYQNQF
ncbi:hypothetical protein DSO57_1003069 [Entomophthora muscae]|uniref:Uncharacterized protein n=1 Tax=Entomophthora muscae TaxID=34485 RepID=A0ACC2TJW4_9FUNG|nr:hypothetical protein DSO57_1003069 [Entomophthora muscae]